MGLRRAFAGAAIGGLVGGLLGGNAPGLSQVGFTAGLLSGGQGGGGFGNREVRDAWTTSRFEARHPIAAARWDAAHTSPGEAALAASNPMRAARLEAMDLNRTVGGPVSPFYPPGVRFGGPSLAGSIYPAAGIAASGGAFVGGALSSGFNTLAQGLSSLFGGGTPAPEQPRIVYGGPSFTPSGFNSA